MVLVRRGSGYLRFFNFHAAKNMTFVILCENNCKIISNLRIINYLQNKNNCGNTCKV